MRLFSMRSRWSRQTNLRWSLRISAPGSRWDSHRIWKPLQMPSTGMPLLGRRDDLGHHRREPRDGPAAQVVAVREAARQDHRVDALEVVVAVPERDRLVAADAHGAAGVVVVERAREGDDADPSLVARLGPRSPRSPGWTAASRPSCGPRRASRRWPRRRPRARSACPAGRRRRRRTRAGAARRGPPCPGGRGSRAWASRRRHTGPRAGPRAWSQVSRSCSRWSCGPQSPRVSTDRAAAEPEPSQAGPMTAQVSTPVIALPSR